MIIPRLLQPGDKISIIAPATTVKSEYVAGACRRLEREGLQPIVMPHVIDSRKGSFAASQENRCADLCNSLSDDSISAILCARGGYGCVHLLPQITDDLLQRHPKWIIGFSDVSALHARMLSADICSLHAPMAKHLTLESDDDPSTLSLLHLLMCDRNFRYEVEGSSFNISGNAKGVLRGGNMAVLDGLTATPFDILDVKDGEDVVLFIEDIAEPLYKIDRMMWRLYLNGTLHRLKGLIVGRFTEYKPDANWQSVEQLISNRLHEWQLTNLPTAFNFPVGHVSHNLAMPEGFPVKLTVGKNKVILESDF